ncbi:MAG: L,D-transpeptidase [Jatrophihabitans sp.]
MNRRTMAALCATASVLIAGCSSVVAAPPATPSSALTPSIAAQAAPISTSAAVAAAKAAPEPRTVAASTPPPAAPNPCAHNSAGQLVRVELAVQRMWLCTGHRLDSTTPITSGIPGEYTSTPTGTYTIQALTRNTTLTLISGQTYAVKYWIPFDSPLFGFHDSSWQDIPYGSQKYRTEGSHGCVHVPLAAIRFLYHWADIGAKVRITE